MDEHRRTRQTKTPESFLDILVTQADRTKTDAEFKRLKITERTIIAQAIAFFLGGYDTTASFLTHLFEVLSRRSDIQKKMQKELECSLEKVNGEINHESTRDSEIPYIVGVIKETLRLFPSVVRPGRMCTADWTSSEHDISISKRTRVIISAWAANRNPEVYESPEDFVPERWLPENKHMYFMGWTHCQ